MSSNIANTVAYLRTSRDFTEDIKTLSKDLTKAYIDIANAVNVRTIGIFSTNKSSITGDSWYLTSQRRQSLRQVYTFTTFASINHNISVPDPSQFINCYGSYTDGTNTYGLIFGTSVAIPGQIVFYITSTQIVFVVGAGAPSITPSGKGTIVLYWLSQV